MKQNKIFIGMFFAALFIAGCYTQLMTPQEYVETRKNKIKAEAAYSSGTVITTIQYDRNCLSCHSRYELDDRYIEMQAAGISTVHGFLLTPDAWAYEFVPTYNPDPYGWYNPFPPIPWWLPASSGTVGTAGGTTVNNPTSGNTGRRDDGPIRVTNSPVREPISTYAPPVAPAPAPTVSTPAPAVSSAPPAQNQQPQSSTNESTTTRTSSDNSSRRNDGPTRTREPR